MMLITITNWKRKAAVALKLLFFLLLIGLIIPQFLTFIAGGWQILTRMNPIICGWKREVLISL